MRGLVRRRSFSKLTLAGKDFSQIRALLRTGELRGIQIGGRDVWRIGATAIEDFIAEAYRKTADRIAAGELKDVDQGSEESRTACREPLSNEAHGSDGSDADVESGTRS